MNWASLYDMQQKLDTYIIETHQLENESLFDERMLALLVELGELANETRCFKFWSHKKANERDVILEEYVDNIHFILSLGLTTDFRYESKEAVQPINNSLTDQFVRCFTACTVFNEKRSKETYQAMFDSLLQIGLSLGFSTTDIQQAYLKKNEINFKRQDDGY